MARGAPPEALSITELGWISSIGVVTTDAFGAVIVQWQGADLETNTFMVYPDIARIIGNWQQDPAGWVQKYFRPNPASTAGMYVVMVISSGHQGFQIPFVPTFKLSAYLRPESTQASAYVSAGAYVIAVTSPKMFLVSLRKILGVKGKIDADLFSIGPVHLEEE